MTELFAGQVTNVEAEPLAHCHVSSALSVAHGANVVDKLNPKRGAHRKRCPTGAAHRALRGIDQARCRQIADDLAFQRIVMEPHAALSHAESGAVTNYLARQ